MVAEESVDGRWVAVRWEIGNLAVARTVAVLKVVETAVAGGIDSVGRKSVVVLQLVVRESLPGSVMT